MKRFQSGSSNGPSDGKNGFGVGIAFGIFFIIVAAAATPGYGGGWSDVKIRLLPESSFAGADIDLSGNRIWRSPHHDANGDLDPEQLIYVLGTFEREAWQNENMREEAKKHLESHYAKRVAPGAGENLDTPMNLNDAKLSDLVRLPQVGPVLAVKIVEHRTMYGAYQNIEEIKKVEGIGQGTFNAVRHYIKVD
jgi:competence ComEA-like helix-hairpin-helix protein